MTKDLADDTARERIRTDLTTNLLVEAGAGSGKTTALVRRLLQHVVSGTPIEQVAAVTFTRKAADELRERLQLRLEAAMTDATLDEAAQYRCATALRDLDRAFLGTIHSFCARILREHPLEAGLDPAFIDIPEADVEPMNRDFWRRWVDVARLDGDGDLQVLLAAGVEPADLHDAFANAMLFADVDFDAPDVPLPDVASCRLALADLLDRALALMPHDLPVDGPDALMESVQRLRFQRSISDWDDPAVFCTLLGTLSENKLGVTQKRWSESKEGRKVAKELHEDFLGWFTQRVAPVLRAWREHLYPCVMRTLRRAVAEFAAERHETGRLGFDDLLFLCARVLRENPDVRNELGQRYRYLLVDEFQDTDPVQAEVCLLLASASSEGNDWQAVTPRPGALFVVGDPKQSIYRFRRADIQIYERVRERFTEFGATLALTTNFRSLPVIGELVNTYFQQTFPAHASAEQAAFSPLVSEADGVATAMSGVFRYVVQVESASEIVPRDAEFLAAWIASQIAAGERPGHFLILTEKKAPIAAYARALAERNIAVTTTGADLTQEHELRELMVVLRALADPENPVLVAAALEGLFFGLTPADLWSAHQRRVRLSIGDGGAGDDHPAARALAVLQRWWRLSRQAPADVLLDRILDETGLLCLAAGESLGDARAGALLHLVETVRAVGAIGQSGLTDAIAVIDALLDAEADDAPLLPGRTDAVRVMNLHKAKGLEADIVILAAPTDHKTHEPQAHVSRAADGPRGGLLISKGSGTTRQRIAQPPGWDEMSAAELRFSTAEKERLRYVATTRARRVLVVAQAERMGKTVKADASMWRPLAPTLDVLEAQALVPGATHGGGRDVLSLPGASLERDARAAAARVSVARTASLIRGTVTGDLTRDDVRAEAALAGGGASGREWGDLVHRGLEALARGRRGASLRGFAHAIVAETGGTTDDAERLMKVLDAVQATPLWSTLVATGALMPELPVMHVTVADGIARVTQGVIDLAVCAPDAWRIVDWKSDDVTDEVWMARRAEKYDRQLAHYSAMLMALTARTVDATLVRVDRSSMTA